MKVLPTSLLVIIFVTAFAHPLSSQEQAGPDVRASLEALANGDHRSEQNKARNKYRHPVETLMFFGIEPDMTVVELFPGGGWYLEILAPFLKDDGTYYAAIPNPQSERGQEFRAHLDNNVELYGDVKLSIANAENQELAPAGTADLVLTFRNMHNFMHGGYDTAIYAAAYEALKPGGIFGVVEHRGRTDEPQDPEAGSGYVREDYAIERIESVGFELVDKSEINANPKDTKDYTMGVWTLPPTLRLGIFRQDHFLEIGESDRFTLKFRKPADGE